jgi:hypothetical protein
MRCRHNFAARERLFGDDGNKILETEHVGALAGLENHALEYLAMLIHLAKLSFGVSLVPAMNEQIFDKQSVSSADAKSVLQCGWRRHEILVG